MNTNDYTHEFLAFCINNDVSPHIVVKFLDITYEGKEKVNACPFSLTLSEQSLLLNSRALRTSPPNFNSTSGYYTKYEYPAKIECIKKYRERTGKGLGESKTNVEEWIRVYETTGAKW